MTTIPTVNINAVRKSPTNPRKRVGDLTELVASIKTAGVLQPILVRPLEDRGKYECIFGHRRLEAAKKAGLEVIPAQIREMSDNDVIQVQLIENLQREDIHPLEEADSFKQLLDREIMSVDDIAVRVGKSKSYVYQRLKLAELGPKVREAYFAEKISHAMALMLTRLSGEKQEDALKQILEHSYDDQPADPREVSWIFRAYTHDLRNAPFSTKDADLVINAGPCSTCPKRSGNQRDLFGDVAGEHPETCTDPACFESKVQANWTQQQAKAARKGLTIINHVGRGHVAAQKEHPLGWQADNKTWKQLTGGKVKPIAVTLDKKTGEVLELYDREAAEKALPAAVLNKAKKQNVAKPTSQPKKQGPVVNFVRQGELVAQRMCAALVEAAKEMDNDEFTDVMARGFLGSNDTNEHMFEALGWPKNLKQKEVRERLTDAEPWQLRAFALLINAEYLEDQVLKELGADNSAIDKAARAELLAEAKAKLKAEAEAKKAQVKTKAKKKATKAKKHPAAMVEADDLPKTNGIDVGIFGVCRVCGCTNDDCSECIEITGEPCTWADEDHTLCSRCAPAASKKTSKKKAS